MNKQLEEITINIKLHTLSRHRRVEKRGKAEPYLWIIFFRVDGSKLLVLPNFKLKGSANFNFAPGSHGNLGISSINHESTVKIPTEIGEWVTPLIPIHIPHFEQKVPGIVGVICALMEQNNVSYKGAEAGHFALNSMVEQAVNNALESFDPRIVDIQNVMPSIATFFEKKVEEFTDGMETKIVGAIKKNQSLLRNLWSLVNSDNLIGYNVWHFDHQQILDKGSNGIDFTHHWVSPEHGDWEIFGNVKVIDHDHILPAPMAVMRDLPGILPKRAPEVGEDPERKARE